MPDFLADPCESPERWVEFRLQIPAWLPAVNHVGLLCWGNSYVPRPRSGSEFQEEAS